MRGLRRWLRRLGGGGIRGVMRLAFFPTATSVALFSTMANCYPSARSGTAVLSWWLLMRRSLLLVDGGQRVCSVAYFVALFPFHFLLSVLPCIATRREVLYLGASLISFSLLSFQGMVTGWHIRRSGHCYQEQACELSNTFKGRWSQLWRTERLGLEGLASHMTDMKIMRKHICIYWVFLDWILSEQCTAIGRGVDRYPIYLVCGINWIYMIPASPFCGFCDIVGVWTLVRRGGVGVCYIPRLGNMLIPHLPKSFSFNTREFV